MSQPPSHPIYRPCRLKTPCKCGSQRGHITASGNSHPARLVCWSCGKFLKWLSKADAARAKAAGLLQVN